MDNFRKVQTRVNENYGLLFAAKGKLFQRGPVNTIDVRHLTLCDGETIYED